MQKIKQSRSNHLSGQTSPYLLQHLSNPVDWYPWTDEAFEKAVKEDKMIFLSIGYSTCHWCHVMAHESFEYQEVANILSNNFVAIKVDREERPDIDDVYMSVCQALTGSGGWPLTIIMTPYKKPFYAGTCLPLHNYMNRIGLIELLNQVSSLWRRDKDKLVKQSETIIEHIKGEALGKHSHISYDVIMKDAYRNLDNQFDPNYGGFSTQPKFPSPHTLFYLLRYYISSKNVNALNMVETTLTNMYKGGIFDHVGYGFSRYSTDNRWLIPHFEKMLYDNALLLLAYTECYSVTKKQIYKDVVCKIAEFIERDMLSSDGAFYSAYDADSEGVEGKYYVFSYTELEEFLEAEELKYLEKQYNVTRSGNFEGNNILNTIGIESHNKDIDITVINELFEYRKKRIPPFLDKKILSSWNGLMIAALSYVGSIINEKYLRLAKMSAEYVLENMVDDNYNVFTSFKDNKLTDTGFLSDFTNFVWGLINLYSATLETQYLEYAIRLSKSMIDKFWDKNDHIFYLNERTDDELPLRPKDNYDGAMPSGSSVAIMNLLRLYYYTNNETFKDVLDKLTKSLSVNAQTMPTAYIHFVSALQLYTHPHRQIIITGNNQLSLYKRLQRMFLPFTTIILYDDEKLTKLIPQLRNYPLINKLKVYICENYACSNPIDTEEELLRILSAQ